MGIVQNLITMIKDEHNAVDSLPFLQRYFSQDQSNLLTPTDHYRQLRQLLPIYISLELLMKPITVYAPLPENLQFLLNRSAEISKDIAYLEENAAKLGIDVNENKNVLPSTSDYVAFLDGLDPYEKDIAIFSHFLTRILADLDGGQKTGRFLKEMYCRYDLKPEDGGTAFYEFPKIPSEENQSHESKTLVVLKKWLDNHKVYKDAKFLSPGVLESLSFHKEIFTELESTRSVNQASNVITNATALSPLTSSRCQLTGNRSPATAVRLECPVTKVTDTLFGLFTPRNVAIAFVFGAGAVAATVSYYQKP